MFCDVTRPHLTILRLLCALAIVWLLSSFVEDAASGTRDMVRPVKFLCSDVGSIEVVGNAILSAHRNEEDQDAAARLAAKPFIEAGTCVLLPRPAEVRFGA